jgi:hypothetical protein
MQRLVKNTLYLFLFITGATAIITLIGICYVWFYPDARDLPHLKWLVLSIIIEMVGVIIMLAKKGLKYLPATQTDKKPEDTLRFMGKFISEGTSATIVSNRVSWLSSDESLIAILQSRIESGGSIEIVTPSEVPDALMNALPGAQFIVTEEENAPEARFTLINGNRSGSEKLAIARGVHPEHEITIFDNDSGPQMIAMAKDIIRKSKRLANA